MEIINFACSKSIKRIYFADIRIITFTDTQVNYETDLEFPVVELIAVLK
jgi:hypothetical protein